MRDPKREKLNKDVQISWEKFLDPDELRPALIAASVYIATFENLKTTIVDRIKDFYTNGFDDRTMPNAAGDHRDGRHFAAGNQFRGRRRWRRSG